MPTESDRKGGFESQGHTQGVRNQVGRASRQDRQRSSSARESLRASPDSAIAAHSEDQSYSGGDNAVGEHSDAFRPGAPVGSAVQEKGLPSIGRGDFPAPLLEPIHLTGHGPVYDERNGPRDDKTTGKPPSHRTVNFLLAHALPGDLSDRVSVAGNRAHAEPSIRAAGRLAHR